MNFETIHRKFGIILRRIYKNQLKDSLGSVELVEKLEFLPLILITIS